MILTWIRLTFCNLWLSLNIFTINCVLNPPSSSSRWLPPTNSTGGVSPRGLTFLFTISSLSELARSSLCSSDEVPDFFPISLRILPDSFPICRRALDRRSFWDNVCSSIRNRFFSVISLSSIGVLDGVVVFDMLAESLSFLRDGALFSCKDKI